MASLIVPIRKWKRKQVPRACVNCRKSHSGCDMVRPCAQCVAHGLQDTCTDLPRKNQRRESDKITNSSSSAAFASAAATAGSNLFRNTKSTFGDTMSDLRLPPLRYAGSDPGSPIAAAASEMDTSSSDSDAASRHTSGSTSPSGSPRRNSYNFSEYKPVWRESELDPKATAALQALLAAASLAHQELLMSAAANSSCSHDVAATTVAHCAQSSTLLA